jgi:hypothetical protein
MDAKTIAQRDDDLSDLYRQRRTAFTEQGSELLLNLAHLVRSEQWIFAEYEYSQPIEWDEIEKSRFIESYWLNIPILPVTLIDLDYRTKEVIDGRVRIMSIVDFYDGKFALNGLQMWTELNGRTYRDLPYKLKDSLDRKRLKTTTFLDIPTNLDPDSFKKMVYLRLNDRRLG